MIKAYLDTCIISGIIKNDISTEQMNAVGEMIKKYKQSLIMLVKSDISNEEIDQIPEKFKKPHQIILNFFADIELSNYNYSDSGLLLLGVGGGSKEKPAYTKIKTILPDENDAKHFFQAVCSQVEYFITTDQKTILKYSDLLFKEFNIRVVSPEIFIKST